MIDLVDFTEKLGARLAAEGSTANVVYGREQRRRNDNQGPGTANRVVVYPGPPDDDTGDWGRLAATKHAHPLVRPDELTHWQRCTLDVWAYDDSAASDEGAQDRAVNALWQCVARSAWYLIRVERHDSTFLAEGAPLLRNSPGDRRHGARVVSTFLIAFAVRAARPEAIAAPAIPEPVTAAGQFPSGKEEAL